MQSLTTWAKRKPRLASASLWFLAGVITLACFAYQDKTGPTYPLAGDFQTAQGTQHRGKSLLGRQACDSEDLIGSLGGIQWLIGFEETGVDAVIDAVHGRPVMAGDASQIIAVVARTGGHKARQTDLFGQLARIGGVDVLGVAEEAEGLQAVGSGYSTAEASRSGDAL